MERQKIIAASCLLFLLLSSTLQVHAEEKLGYKPEEEKNLMTDDSEIYQTLTVDKNNNGAYENIQDAINNAQTGSTIYVKKGVYNEIFTINKKIDLIGENKDTTLINPTSKKNSYAIRITASGVKLSGLQIKNNGEGLYTTGIKIISPETTIENCDIFDTPVGIAVWSSYTAIENCRFWGCEDEGIVFLGTATTKCNNNLIENCKFFDNCDGIEMQHSSNNHISNCEFYDNTHAGIDAIGSSNNNNKITNCKVYDNKVFGIYLSRSSGNQVTKCSISKNKIMATSSKENTITDCTLDEIYLIDGSELSITDCTGVDETKIKTINSEYKINNEESNIPVKIDNKNIHSRSYFLNKIYSIFFSRTIARIQIRNLQ